MSEVHEHRQMAESFGSDAERYDRTREPYPDALIRAAAAERASLLDVGCGTGIAARQFQAAGCAVLGVEPDPRMATFARKRGTEVDVATFEAWEPAGRTFDAVVAGTAWHWVNPVAGAAKAARVLRPDGLLALFWHVFQLPPQILDPLAAAFRRVAPESPVDLSAMRNAVDAYQAILIKTADGIRATGAFTEPEQQRHDWNRTYTRDEWLDHLPTTGGLAGLPADRRGEVLAAAGDAIDTLGGRFTLPYATLAVIARKDC